MLKIQTTADALGRVVKQVLPAVTGRSSLAILNHVLLRGDDAGLTVEGTDLEIFVSRRMDEGVSVLSPGALTVGARLISSLLQKLPAGEDVTIEGAEKGGCSLKCGSRKYALAGVPAEEYPKMPVIADDAICVQIPEKIVGRLIGETAYGDADTKDTRKYLQSVYFVADGGTLQSVVTDTHRLAMSNSWIECDPALKAIIPVGFARIIAGSVGEGDAIVCAMFDRHAAQFLIGGNLTIHCRLVEAQYPNYRRVIPVNHDTTITFDRSEMLQAIDRVMLIGVEDAQRVHFEITDSVVNLYSAESRGGQEGQETVALSSLTGDPLTTAFNGKYLHDCLSAYNCESIRVRLSQPLRPCLFDRNEDDCPQMSLLMPMQVQGGTSA